MRELVAYTANIMKPMAINRQGVGLALCSPSSGFKKTKQTMALTIRLAHKLGWLKKPPCRGNEADLLSQGLSHCSSCSICSQILAAYSNPAINTPVMTVSANKRPCPACIHILTHALSKTTAKR